MIPSPASRRALAETAPTLLYRGRQISALVAADSLREGLHQDRQEDHGAYHGEQALKVL